MVIRLQTVSGSRPSWIDRKYFWYLGWSFHFTLLSLGCAGGIGGAGGEFFGGDVDGSAGGVFFKAGGDLKRIDEGGGGAEVGGGGLDGFWKSDSFLLEAEVGGRGGGLEIRIGDGFCWVFAIDGTILSGLKDLLSKQEWDAVKRSV